MTEKKTNDQTRTPDESLPPSRRKLHKLAPGETVEDALYAPDAEPVSYEDALAELLAELE